MNEKTATGELRLRVLAELSKAPDCLHAADLAETIGTRADAIHVVLRRLQAGAFVRRAGRGCWKPTDKGRRYVERIRSFVA